MRTDKKNLSVKIKKRRWDAVLIGTLMSTAFAVIMMRFTGYWPCEIISALKIEDVVSCSRSPQENLATVYASIQQGVVWLANLAR
ncbi:MAG TPA: hypothetical protein VKA09_15150 [Nitrososphaeraceae archaeon]|nr:hypothetical protein [Nitrososphaeraceae archaeon]